MSYFVTYQRPGDAEPSPIKQDGTNVTFYATGAEANAERASMARSYPNVTYRVARKAPSDTAGLDWRAREAARFDDGTYSPVPWASEGWAPIAGHFVHLSKDQLGKVAFTEDDAKGAADRQTVMAPGRYLTRFYADTLTPAEIGTWAARVADNDSDDDGVAIAMTPDDIEAAYRAANLGSCMAHAAHHYDGHMHPVRVYGAGDLGVATLVRGNDTVGRVLCWPAKKLYGGRFYGDETRLERALIARGYTCGSLAGARILKVENESGSGYIMPYIDREGADDTGSCKFFTLTAGHASGNMSTNETEGVTESDDRTTCEGCGERTDDAMNYIESIEESRCDDCVRSDFSRCDHDGELYRDNEMVEAMNDRRRCVSIYSGNLSDADYVTLADGEVVHCDLAALCVDCDDYHDVNDVTDGDDGEYRCDHHHAAYEAELAALAETEADDDDAPPRAIETVGTPTQPHPDQLVMELPPGLDGLQRALADIAGWAATMEHGRIVAQLQFGGLNRVMRQIAEVAVQIDTLRLLGVNDDTDTVPGDAITGYGAMPWVYVNPPCALAA